MSGGQWIIWSTLGIVGAAICAVVYYRAGGETTWPFVLIIAFVVVWAPVQVWLRHRSRAAFERIRQRREGAS